MQQDRDGNLDMSRANKRGPLDLPQQAFMEQIKLKANELNQLYQDGKTAAWNGEAARLWAVAITQLELASMAAVKAVTTDKDTV